MSDQEIRRGVLLLRATGLDGVSPDVREAVLDLVASAVQGMDDDELSTLFGAAKRERRRRRKRRKTRGTKKKRVIRKNPRRRRKNPSTAMVGNPPPATDPGFPFRVPGLPRNTLSELLKSAVVGALAGVGMNLVGRALGRKGTAREASGE